MQPNDVDTVGDLPAISTANPLDLVIPRPKALRYQPNYLTTQQAIHDQYGLSGYRQLEPNGGGWG